MSNKFGENIGGDDPFLMLQGGAEKDTRKTSKKKKSKSKKKPDPVPNRKGRTHERKSGTGIPHKGGKEKRDGKGKGNWGNSVQDDVQQYRGNRRGGGYQGGYQGGYRRGGGGGGGGGNQTEGYRRGGYRGYRGGGGGGYRGRGGGGYRGRGGGGGGRGRGRGRGGYGGYRRGGGYGGRGRRDNRRDREEAPKKKEEVEEAPKEKKEEEVEEVEKKKDGEEVVGEEAVPKKEEGEGEEEPAKKKEAAKQPKKKEIKLTGKQKRRVRQKKKRAEKKKASSQKGGYWDNEEMERSNEDGEVVSSPTMGGIGVDEYADKVKSTQEVLEKKYKKVEVVEIATAVKGPQFTEKDVFIKTRGVVAAPSKKKKKRKKRGKKVFNVNDILGSDQFGGAGGVVGKSGGARRYQDHDVPAIQSKNIFPNL